MKIGASRIAALVAVAAVSVSPISHAQWAVVDIKAIAQMAQQLSTMEQQLGTMQNHFRQAQQEYQSITGSRGMQNLLTGTVRNYLPADWQSLQQSLTSATGAYPALSEAVQHALNANAVLSTGQLSVLSATERNQVLGYRQSVAMLQATTQQALSAISNRFASIQQLINAIGTARDQKAILDLQARISAEQGMLANDETKLQVIYQSAQAQQWASQQKSRELALSDIGSLRSLPTLGL